MTNVFAFRAAAADGRIDGGMIDAESNEAARAALASRGLYVLEIRDRGPRRRKQTRIAASDLALGLRILADLVDAGLPLARALQVFEELAPKGWRDALPTIRQSIREGRSLAAALSDSPISVPPLVLGIVQAGEAGSGLAPAIRRAADLTQSMAETGDAIRAALAYPVVVAFAGIAAIVVLIAVVLPRFAAILQDLGQQLPASTRIVLAIGTTARGSAAPVACVVVLSILAWQRWTAGEQGRRTWHRMLLAIPVVGEVRRATATARAAHALGALLESGVRMGAALTFATRAMNDAELERRSIHARAEVNAGRPLSQAMHDAGALTPTTIRLIRAGEESGRLPDMLSHAARIEQSRADRTVRTAVRMLEPTLLMTFASIVAFVAAALLQAIYSVRPGV